MIWLLRKFLEADFTAWHVRAGDIGLCFLSILAGWWMDSHFWIAVGVFLLPLAFLNPAHRFQSWLRGFIGRRQGKGSI